MNSYSGEFVFVIQRKIFLDRDTFTRIFRRVSVPRNIKTMKTGPRGRRRDEENEARTRECAFCVPFTVFSPLFRFSLARAARRVTIYFCLLRAMNLRQRLLLRTS